LRWQPDPVLNFSPPATKPFCLSAKRRPMTQKDPTMRPDDTPPTRGSALKFLLLIPYLALLWLPFYNDVHPSLMGFPFFYWYQLLWVPLTSLILFVVYRWVR